MNKIEALKAERDGLDVTEDLVRFAREGWRTIADDDKERLKWVGVFHRKPTPGHFMMRIRMANGGRHHGAGAPARRDHQGDRPQHRRRDDARSRCSSAG